MTVLAAPDHDGRLLRRNAELAQQRLRGRVLLEIDPAVRQAVAGANSRAIPL